MDKVFINNAFTKACDCYLDSNDNVKGVMYNSFLVVVIRMLVSIYSELDIINPKVMGDEDLLKENLCKFGYSKMDVEVFLSNLELFYEFENANNNDKFRKRNPYFIIIQKELIDMFIKKKLNFYITNDEVREFYDLLYTPYATNPLRVSFNYLHAKDILKIDKVPEKLNIVGGGIIAVEVANIYSTLGSEVNIIARSKALKEIDSNIKDYIFKNLLSEINILEETDVVECKKNKVITNKNEELEGVPFFATGRVANSEIVRDIVELNPDNTIKVNEIMETTKEHVYAAGDVTGGYQLTPVARMEGITAARNMANYPNKVVYHAIPQTLSLNTEVSFVEDEKNNCSEEDKVDIGIPGIAGPGAFWKILSGDTGYTKISFDKKQNKITSNNQKKQSPQPLNQKHPKTNTTSKNDKMQYF